MKLKNFWPTADQVDECIRTEAETIDEAVLLAVHLPSKITFQAAGSAEKIDKTEQDLLEALLQKNKTGSAVLVALTGASGVGKSHMVRWLHAQIARHKRRDAFVVVLIPKTASLRQVVELILEPLKGVEYDKLRKSLATAVKAISTTDAPLRLASELDIELKHLHAQLRQALSGPGGVALKERVHHAEKLRVLLTDHVFREKMLNAALERITNRALLGNESGDDTLPQFEPSDFIWTDAGDYKEAGLAAQGYYARLGDQDGQKRRVAADVLNSVIEPALRTVFQFAQALGGRTIEEIVNDVRVQLLAEEKELVLLIEDFAALSGIQEPLLNIAIAESQTGGKKVRAPIRTALAVTDGFMLTRNTILTRGKGEWTVASNYDSNDDALDRFVQMTGKYLNAARWGAAALHARFEALSDQSVAGLNDWLPVFADDTLDAHDETLLASFGKCANGFHLFPFNREAIASFCRKELEYGGNIRFNPREFINKVLRETLEHRPFYEKGSFPVEGFKGGTLTSGAETDLDIMPQPGSVKARLKPMLIHWCANPVSLQTASPIAEEIFTTFSLPLPFSAGRRSAKPAPAVKPQPGSVALPSARPSTQSVPTSPAPSPFELEIENWSEDNFLTQKVASRVRKLVIEALLTRIDWTSLNIKKLEFDLGIIWLPYVKVGNPQAGFQVRVAEDGKDVPGWVRKAILGLHKASEAGGWDYQNSDEDYGFVQRLLDTLVPALEAKAIERARSNLTLTLHLLHRQSLLLGITGQQGLPGLIEILFDHSMRSIDIKSAELIADNQRATTINDLLERSTAARPHLQEMLRQQVGCFQGEGKTMLAIDHHRVALAWEEVPNLESKGIFEANATVKQHFVDLFLTLGRNLSTFQGLITAYGVPVVSAIGDDFEREAWIKAIKQSISSAQRLGYLPPGFRQASEFEEIDALGRTLLVDLRNAVTKSLKLPSDATQEEQLRSFGRIDLVRLLQAHKKLGYLENLFVSIGQLMKNDEMLLKNDTTSESFHAFVDDLTTTAAMLTETIL